MINKCLAIIPARGGSKRIPKKNIKKFLGKPIIAYSIEAALQSGLFNAVMVSTDDTEIADIAVKYGASVPFLRSKENAGDLPGILDVLYEVISEYKKRGCHFDNICCILATAPFATAAKIADAYNNLLTSNFECVFPVVSFGYPVQRALKISEQNQVSMQWPENYPKRSQNLEKLYHDAGLFYWYKASFFEKNNTNSFDNSGCLIYDENEAHDIDTLVDWQIAELKYNVFYK